MNSPSTAQSPHSSLFVPPSHAWQRLHAEREAVCAALLGDPNDLCDLLSSLTHPQEVEVDARMIDCKRRELLQARLCQVDDALDRVISGFFGHCIDCGKLIDEQRLSIDLAVSTCRNCRHREAGA